MGQLKTKFALIVLSMLFCSCTIRQIVDKKIALKASEDPQYIHSGILNVSEKIKIPFKFGITTKGNGGLDLPSLRIKIWDSHDDTLYYKNYLLKNYLQDHNEDGYKDLVVQGNVILTEEKSGNIIKEYAIKFIFYFNHEEMKFRTTDKVPEYLTY